MDLIMEGFCLFICLCLEKIVTRWYGKNALWLGVFCEIFGGMDTKSWG